MATTKAENCIDILHKLEMSRMSSDKQNIILKFVMSCLKGEQSGNLINQMYDDKSISDQEKLTKLLELAQHNSDYFYMNR